MCCYFCNFIIMGYSILCSCLFEPLYACRIKSRWFRIQFEELSPKFKGQERCKREDALKKAMKNSKQSIYVMTSYIHKCLSDISVDPEFGEIESILEEACHGPDLCDVDHRAQRQFSIMLFCCKKVNLCLCI